ncbi:hypothetical protein SAMN02982989_3437 [Xaviernesmea oryzae]|uniref:Uncharacterized protein n=1 Tax=Xaviernesmea oryzae TaxID=464029 RepID=A0A1X7GAJ8_9HYPH|nr:hypothetical protein [Xaviernesmea oryzae]SMF66085.1 hypothetical protein SAMN02982989_3437 [Xaviernesmea oryzae]
MSLTGNNVAVLSIGMSCQTSHQIREHASLLREVTGDPSLKVKALPFDWLISQPTSTLSILQSVKRFPDLDELAMRQGKPYWPRHNVYFWHAFKNDEQQFDIPGTYNMVRETMLMRWERFSNAVIGRRLILVMSNTQNDLDGHCRAAGTMSSIFQMSKLNSIAREIRQILAPSAEIVVVSRRDRMLADEEPRGIKLFYHQPDSSRWEGDNAQWAETLTAACSPALAIPTKTEHLFPVALNNERSDLEASGAVPVPA